MRAPHGKSQAIGGNGSLERVPLLSIEPNFKNNISRLSNLELFDEMPLRDHVVFVYAQFAIVIVFMGTLWFRCLGIEESLNVWSEAVKMYEVSFGRMIVKPSLKIEESSP